MNDEHIKPKLEENNDWDTPDQTTPTVENEAINPIKWEASNILETPWEPNINEVLDIYKEKQNDGRDLLNWVNNEWEERDVLDSFLEEINLPKNKETRFAIFSRVVNLNEAPLKVYMNNIKFSNRWQEIILKKAYNLTEKFQVQMQDKILTKVENSNLLSPFYTEIMKWTHNVWKIFNTLFIKYENHVLRTTKELERYFFGNPEGIMDYLHDNDLLDKDWDGNLAGSTYRLLVWKNYTY